MRSAFVLSALVLATSSFAHDRHHERGPPVRIRFLTPDGGHFPALTTSTGWALTLRIEAPGAVAIVETAEPNDTPQSRREAIVLTDPDDCLDMSHFPISNAGQPYHPDCGGADETFLEFTTERFDSFDLPDSNTGNFEIRRDWLVDGAPNAAPPLFLVNRPQTGGSLLDGYGFGPDDDLPGLVIMSNLGPARVFDQNFERATPAAVRNLAGFLNSVAQELSTKRGGSALTAWMHVPAGLFEPVALFDLDIGPGGNGQYRRRLESGPVESFTFSSFPASDDALLAEIASGVTPYTIDVRALVVEGYAPTVIVDQNGDGRFTAADLKLMGHKVISNEARLRHQIDFDVLLSETLSGRTCPPQTLVFRDLDGNGRAGAIPCSGSGGAARVRGVPR